MPSSTRGENKGHFFYLDTNGHLQGTRLNVATSIRKCLQKKSILNYGWKWNRSLSR